MAGIGGMGGIRLERKIWFEPLGLRVTSREGTTIFEAARDAGVALNSVCGGRGTCGQCRIRVLKGDVSPLSDREKASLKEDDIADGFRLACQTRPLSDLKVYVPPASLTTGQKLQLLGTDEHMELDPAVHEYEVHLPEPSLENPLPDWENVDESLVRGLRLENICPELPLLRRLPVVFRSSGSAVGITIRDSKAIDVHPAGRSLLGAALDLGTSKIAIHLVDLQTGEPLGARGAMNPQVAYGEDVMSRITYALEGNEHELRKSVTDTLNELLEQLTGDPGQIAEMTLVGNTAMHHLFLGLPVRQLGQSPYVPAVCRSLDIRARDLGLHIAPGAYVHLLPNIAGFVGSDHVSMLMATGIGKSADTMLGIDIGTNTEVSLVKGGAVSSLSCASGPALEGAHVKHGMKAAVGAIESVKIRDESVELGVIDDAPSIGICGSGILDTVAELRKHKIIDRRGRLHDHPLVRPGSNGQEFILADADTSGTGRDIVLSQGDIAQVQLAKAAIRTGINTLLYEAGVSKEGLDGVVIAGAFGSYIDVRSAIAIGMFPALSLEKFRQVGNAAGVGAKLALLSKKRRDIARDIARSVRYVELARHPGFEDELSRSMLLP